MKYTVLILILVIVMTFSSCTIETKPSDAQDVPTPSPTALVSTPTPEPLQSPCGDKDFIENSTSTPNASPQEPVPPADPSPLPENSLDLYTGALGDYIKVEATGASASSELSAEGILYGAESAIDSDYLTSWQEATEGYGIGEYISVYFEDNTAVSLIYLRLGFAAADTSFENNGKPSMLAFEFSDGTCLVYSFPELNEDIYLSTETPITTSYMKITIMDVYEGLIWEDTAISEIAVYSSII